MLVKEVKREVQVEKILNINNSSLLSHSYPAQYCTRGLNKELLCEGESTASSMAVQFSGAKFAVVRMVLSTSMYPF
jgi:hypothetical protein